MNEQYDGRSGERRAGASDSESQVARTPAEDAASVAPDPVAPDPGGADPGGPDPANEAARGLSVVREGHVTRDVTGDGHVAPGAARADAGAGRERPAAGGTPDGDELSGQGASSDVAEASDSDVSPGASESAGEEASGFDEDELRRLLRETVSELRPDPESLERLRTAVTARRTRRRQVVAGAVATVVLAAVALPMVLRATPTGGVQADGRPANAASSERTRPATPEDDGRAGTDDSADRRTEGGHTEPSGQPPGRRPATAPSTEHRDRGPDSADTLAATAPTCRPDQLGEGSGTASPADGEGVVYGALSVVNVSTSACTVTSRGGVTVDVTGDADRSAVRSVSHTVGDPAPGLPDPSTGPVRLILPPGQAYQVRFAWVAESGECSTPGASGRPENPGDGDSSEGPQSDEDGSAGPDPGAGDGGGERPTSNVVVSHVPDNGTPVGAVATISNACAGTLYHTGAVPAA